MGSRRRWLFGIKAIVSCGLLGWVLWTAFAREGVGALGERIGALDPAWLFAAIALQLAVIGIGVVRWRVLLDAQGMPLPLGWLARSYFVGRFVGAFTPSTAGLDVWRAVDVARRTGRRADATSVILAEKCVGLLGLAGACVLALPLGGGRFLGPGSMAAAAGIGLLAAAGLLVLVRPALLANVARLAPGGLGERLAAVISALRARGLGPRRIGTTVALSMGSHVLTAAVFVATAGALGVNAGSLDVLVVGLAIIVATLLPISIGGVGVREGVAVAMLATVGVGPTEAVLVALLGYLVGQIPAVFGGIFAVRGGRAAPEAAAIAARR